MTSRVSRYSRGSTVSRSTYSFSEGWYPYPASPKLSTVAEQQGKQGRTDSHFRIHWILSRWNCDYSAATLPNVPSSMPTPGPEQTYKDKLAQGAFEIQKCAGCGQHVFYPRVVCPHCGAEKLGWVKASGSGTVYSTTVVRRKPEAGGDYNVALIDLAEGPRMMSRVVGVEPTAVKIGMKVRARIAPETLVEFTPDQP